MKKFNDLDIERIYCGLIGKIIGVRYGSLVEMWDSKQIIEKFSNVDGYFQEYHDYAADDDLNGPIFFYRALKDCKDYSKYGYKDLASCWLNYVPYLHGFYWWGGYGVSEEHTAYLNILNGIMPPLSGSILQNGKIMAEQIGGQIFIDIWGLVGMHNEKLASKLAFLASSVSHDGEAVYGGMYVASMIAAAFDAKSIDEIINRALNSIPSTCTYYKMVKDLIAFKNSNKTQEECFEYIKQNYWNDKYGGNCHIIPNAAIMAYSMLYGEGDFLKTLRIALFSGFDTDCNLGNLGSVMGVFTLLKNVDYKTWILPINDFVCASSVLGYSNIINVPSLAFDIFKTTLRITNSIYNGKYSKCLDHNLDDVYLSFSLPFSSSGIRSENAKLKNDNESLIISFNKEAEVYYKTYYGVSDFSDNRYDPATSPKVYNGQTIYVDYNSNEESDVYIFYEDIKSNTKYLSNKNVKEFKIDCNKDSLICKIGLIIKSKANSSIKLNSLYVNGKIDYEINFKKEIMENYSLYHNEVRQCTYYKGIWQIENNKLVGRCLNNGQLYTSKPIKNFVFKTSIEFLNKNNAGILFKVLGACRQYQLIFGENEVYLYKLFNEKTLLFKNKIALNKVNDVEIKVIDKDIFIKINDDEFNYHDENMIDEGCIGAYVSAGSVVGFDKFIIKEI